MERTIDGKNVIFTISEGLTANKISSYNQILEELLPAPSLYDKCTLDLCHTDNIDSSGVTFVISLFKRMKNLEKSFCIIGASADVQSLFKLMKLDQFFTMQN